MYSLFALLVLVASASAAGVGNRIIGGAPATSSQQHPYQVSIQQAGVHICSGALVKADKVLTTAACTVRLARPNLPLTVKLGSADRTLGGIFVSVRSVQVHPEFRQNILDCDVAVLTILPVQVSATVSPIELVGLGKKAPTGAMMTVTGWGATQAGSRELSRSLMVIRLPVLGNAACEPIYKREGLVVFDRAFCIGYGSTGPTEGDVGNPVVNDRRQLAGIASWGTFNAVPGFPTVVTDFSHAIVRRFIDDNTK